MSEARDALFITQEPGLADSVAPSLRRSGFTIHRMTPDGACMDLLLTSSFALIVIEPPVKDRPIGEVIAEIRSPSSASRNAGVIVLTGDKPPAPLEHLVGNGINRLVRRSHLGSELLMALADLMAVEPRLSCRAILRLHIIAASGSGMILAQTEDLSASGMLIRGSTRNFPLGSEIDFQLALPGQQEPIRGRGQVVRHTHRPAEKIEGFGVRFSNLPAKESLRLRSFLSKH